MDANGVRNDFLDLGIFSPHFLMNKSPFIYFPIVIITCAMVKHAQILPKNLTISIQLQYMQS